MKILVRVSIVTGIVIAVIAASLYVFTHFTWPLEQGLAFQLKRQAPDL